MAIDNMNASDNSGKDFEPCPAGVHPAIVIGVIDLGTHDSNYQGNISKRGLIRLVFETPFTLMDDGKPFVVVEKWTSSLNSKSGFRKMLEAWRGKPFTEGETFSPRSLLGQKCMINVVHSAKQDGSGVWSNVKGITKIPINPQSKLPMFEVGEAQNTLKYLTLGQGFDRSVFDSLGKATREFIAQSYEFKQMFPKGLWPKPNQQQGQGQQQGDPGPSNPQGAPGYTSDDGDEPLPPVTGGAYDDDIPF